MSLNDDYQQTAAENRLAKAKADFPIGAKVRYWPVKGREEHHDGEIRSEPWEVGGGSIIILITGKSGGVAIDHLARLK